MRILFCNKYNYAFSGTENYMFEAMELLRANGHEAALFSMLDSRGEPTAYDRHFMPPADFKNQRGWFRQAELAAHAIYSIDARRKIRAMIAEFRPDVAHVRNIYHHLSPSILWELRTQNIPVVYHLNDFKVLCPSYNLVSHGNACERCRGGAFRHVFKEKCYSGLAARVTLVAEAYFHKWLGTYRKCVNCFLAPSRFVRDKFVEHGWDAARFEILPHFQAIKHASKAAKNAPLLYFGRLSAEKGVGDLIRAMAKLPQLRLIIAGDGPERSNLERLSATLGLTNITFAGHLQGMELDNAIAAACFTVLPSHAYETFGKTILESYAHGRAVIATDMGSRRELVHEDRTGLLFSVGDVEQLVSAIEFLSSRPQLAEEMGRAGQESLCKYTPQAHYEFLLSLYERLAHKKSGIQTTGEKMTLSGLLPRISLRRPQRTNFFPMEQLTAQQLSQPRKTLAPQFPQKPNLRIAFIGGRGVVSKYSGVETYYEEVGSRLAAMGHQVTAYCRTYFTLPLHIHRGMQLVRLPTVRSKHIETLLHTLLSTLHVLTQPCDIVHYHALGPALFSFIPRLAGKKTVVTVQGLDWQRQKWGHIASTVLRLGEHAAASFPSETIVVSQILRQHYLKRFGVETSYVPNGGLLRDRCISSKLFEWGLEPNNYILFLGRFSPEKGCHLLVEAYEQLRTSAKLAMAGTSSYCDEYSRELRSHASECIKIMGAVSGDDLDVLLTNAMLFVLPSDLEGLSLALLDAMGAGLCVLTSDIPENREAIQGAGFTFRRGDMAGLTERMQFLLANPAVREAAGQAARRRISEHYQWSKVAENTERVYFQVMGRDLLESAKKPSVSVQSASTSAQRKTG
jgi:glycosyltransferase involved in cell wall biosynthesis